jgi:hypothetical protein
MLPMSKAWLITKQDMYISSVATTAGVARENVKILSIDEVSTRSSRISTERLLLGVSVSVQTSVIIVAGQQTYIKDQTVLNSNLNTNGLPSGTIFVQSPSVVKETTPAPALGGSNLPLGPIVGGAIGLLVFVAGTFLGYKACPIPSPSRVYNHLFF